MSFDKNIINIINKYIDYKGLFHKLMEDVKFIDDENSGEAEGNNQVLDFYNNKYKQDGYEIDNINCEMNSNGSITFFFKYNRETGNWANVYYSNGYFRVLGGLSEDMWDLIKNNY